MGVFFFQYSNVLSQGISFLGFHQRLVFWNSIHQEVASGPFCLLVNSPWPLVFILCVFFFFLSAFNLYCWKGVHFSWSLDLNFFLFFSFILAWTFISLQIKEFRIMGLSINDSVYS